jgi:hypothetical protein
VVIFSPTYIRCLFCVFINFFAAPVSSVLEVKCIIRRIKEPCLLSHVILASPFSTGGESLARKGFGRVRIEPAANMSVDVFLTHTCASDENGWCREAQIKQVPYTVINTVLLGARPENLDFCSFPSHWHRLEGGCQVCSICDEN